MCICIVSFISQTVRKCRLCHNLLYRRSSTIPCFNICSCCRYESICPSSGVIPLCLPVGLQSHDGRILLNMSHKIINFTFYCLSVNEYKPETSADKRGSKIYYSIYDIYNPVTLSDIMGRSNASNEML